MDARRNIRGCVMKYPRLRNETLVDTQTIRQIEQRKQKVKTRIIEPVTKNYCTFDKKLSPLRQRFITPLTKNCQAYDNP